MLTLGECFKDIKQIDETSLAKLSGQLWELGTVQQIKEKVSHELFILHIGINVIGIWKSDGWWSIISEYAELVPFIPDTLKAFGLLDLKATFEKIISYFPENTVYINDENYCDTVNFLQNTWFKVSSEKLNVISLEKRKEMVKSVHRYLEELEQMTEPLWGYSGENNGWKNVLDYISACQ